MSVLFAQSIHFPVSGVSAMLQMSLLFAQSLYLCKPDFLPGVGTTSLLPGFGPSSGTLALTPSSGLSGMLLMRMA